MNKQLIFLIGIIAVLGIFLFYGLGKPADILITPNGNGVLTWTNQGNYYAFDYNAPLSQQSQNLANQNSRGVSLVSSHGFTGIINNQVAIPSDAQLGYFNPSQISITGAQASYQGQGIPINILANGSCNLDPGVQTCFINYAVVPQNTACQLSGYGPCTYNQLLAGAGFDTIQGATNIDIKWNVPKVGQTLNSINTNPGLFNNQPIPPINIQGTNQNAMAQNLSFPQQFNNFINSIINFLSGKGFHP